MNVVVAPMHLKSMTEICGCFGKSRISVKGWYENKAPIAFDGKQYFAEYNALQAWLVEFNRKELISNTTPLI